MVGVSVRTLQRWDREGKLKSSRTPSGRRAYSDRDWAAIVGKRVIPSERKTVVYARVSSQAQKPDLKNQRERLEQFCISKGLTVDEWVDEIGGGLNFKRPKFVRLVDEIVAGRVACLVIAHKERLARFGFDLLKHLCLRQECELLVLNTESLSPEGEMVEDLMAITHCFSARLCGLSNYRKALKKALSDNKGTQD